MDMSEGGIRSAEYRPCVCSLSADMGTSEEGSGELSIGLVSVV